MPHGMAVFIGALGLAYCWVAAPALADWSLQRRGIESLKTTNVLRATIAIVIGFLFFAIAEANIPPRASFCLATISIAMAVIVLCDIKATIIPNGFCLSVWMFGLAYQYFFNGVPGLVSGLTCAALCAFVITAVHLATRKTRAVGLGDVKLFPAIGLIAGIPGMSFGLICSFFPTVIALVGSTLIQKRSLRGLLKKPFPLAPTLALCLVCGVSAELVLL